MKNFAIVNDDRTGSVNKMTVKVTEGHDGTDAEIFVAEWLEEKENRQIESFGSPNQIEIEPNVFVIRWN